jgi:hypothetical protein
LQITIDIPPGVAQHDARELADRARLLLVIDGVRAGRLSRAGGARALDLPLDEFIIAAGRHGLYAIDYDPKDFKRELDDIDARGF